MVGPPSLRRAVPLLDLETTSMRRRYVVLPLIVLALAVLHGCGESDSSPSSTTSGTHLDLTHAAPAPYTAHGSVEQVYVLDAPAGATLDLATAAGAVMQTATTDPNGSALFRDVQPGSGYVVATEAGPQLEASSPITVMAPNAP